MNETQIRPTATWDERERLQAIETYEILDTPVEEEFEDIVKMAAQACHAPISLISFVVEQRQFFKAAVGLDVRETPRDVSICAHAIRQSELFVVPDLSKDPRFQDNPYVQGEGGVRFYAGAVLQTAEGLPLGSMCILDYRTRELTEAEGFILKALARQVMVQLELRRALKAKNKSEERLTLALESSGFVGTWDWDVVNDRVFADPHFVAIFGGKPEWTAQGAPVAEYVKAIHPEDRARVKAAMREAVRVGDVFREEYRLVQADGSVRWIESRGKCRRDETGRAVRFPGVAVDITERKRHEQAVREGAERFRFMAESMPQKIFTARPTGDVDYLNQRWFDFTGLSADQIYDWGWTQFIHPDDVEENVRRWKAAVAEGTFFEFEHRCRRHDGVYRWHLSRAHPLRNERGEVVMWIGSNTDIDDQRRANEHLEQTVEERTARLRATVSELEAFSYSISHDMRAPLRAMQGYAKILNEDYGGKLDEQANRYLERIARASARMDDLIQDVLSFSQVSREEFPLAPIHGERLIREIIESYPNLGPNELEIQLAGVLSPVLANEAALTQCVSNLLDNAVKFVRPGMKPAVRIWSEVRGEMVRLWFQDNGIGVSPEDAPRIFEIFYRVNRASDGTGIGLAIVKKAAERMRGRVGFESKIGEGASFWLDLQRA